MAEVPDFDFECFFISPIGAPDSPEREQSDGVLAAIVEPAARELDLVARRADSLPEPGQITSQIIEHLMRARAVVADLSGGNPNVYYELAIRHALRLPAALLAEKGTRLPFDTSQMRTIFYVPNNYKSGASARDELVSHLRSALQGSVDSPVTTTVDLQSLREGSPVERQLLDVVTAVESLSREVQGINGLLRELLAERAEVSEFALHDLQVVNDELQKQLSDDPPELNVERLASLLASVNRHLQLALGDSLPRLPRQGESTPTLEALMEALKTSVENARRGKTEDGSSS
jgi:hypothetical protein